MNATKGILIGVGALILLILIAVGVTAASVAGESNKAEPVLKELLKKHENQAVVSKKLTELGFEMQDSTGESTGLGPVHSLVVYSTRLKVKLKFNAEGQNIAYDLTRE